MELFPEKSLVIIPSFSERIMANDIPYRFRQQTDFWYLSGLQEPDSILIFEKRNAKDFQFTMFVRPRDPSREKWDGARSGTEGATSVFGADQAFNLEEIPVEFLKILERTEGEIFFDHKINPSLTSKLAGPFQRYSRQMGLRSPTPAVESLRLFKSPAEIELMRKSGFIAAESMKEVMKVTRPGVSEDLLAATMHVESRRRGAQRLAYPPVVAGGINANTLHYVTNDMLLDDGDLVLVDAGCEYFGYTSDITRAWPVSGKFTPAQEEVYRVVLEANKKCIQLCRADSDMSIYKLQQKASQILLEGLVTLGIKSRLGGLVGDIDKFYPHNIGHYLGMDTHDTSHMSGASPLQPGMVITIEPGLYIPDEPSVPSQYRGIGIRIEDNVVITEGEPQVFTNDVPKEPEEIEALMASR